MPLRNTLLLLASALLALFIGFFAFTPKDAVGFLGKWGYWGILLTFGGYVWAVAIRLRSVKWELDVKAYKSFLPDVLIVLCFWGLLVVHEAQAFKIIMDEINLLGTSMSMHFDRQLYSPLRGYDINGSFLLTNGYIDKRPYFFPFLVSILHDAFGYRPENAFYLNNALLLICLGLVYKLGHLIGDKIGGRLAVVALATVPLMAQVGNGGGFELLNLVMILAVTVHAIHYLRLGREVDVALLLIATALLVQVRYESVLFIIPVGLVVLCRWLLVKRVEISPVMILSPLLFVPYPLLHNVFKVSEASWQLESKDGFEKPFSLEYMPDNLTQALAFFSDLSHTQPNSVVLSVLGGIALCILVVRTLSILIRREDLERGDCALLIMLGGVFLLFLFLMAYFWGDFTDSVVRRLSLPVFLLFVLPLPWAIRNTKSPRKFGIAAAGILLFGFIGHSLPTMSKNMITQDYLPGRHTEWKREFMRQQPDNNYLVIDNPGLWVTHKVPAVMHQEALEEKQKLQFLLRNHAFRDIYVYQRFVRNFKTDALISVGESNLDEDFILEPVSSYSFSGLSYAKIMRVVDVKVDEPLDPGVELTAEMLNTLSKEERQVIEDEIMRHWMRVLP